MRFASVDDETVELDHHDFIHARITQDLPKGEAVAAARDQDAFGIRVEEERRQSKGLVIDELVESEEFYDGVEKKSAAVIRNGRDRDFLKFRPLAKDPLFDAEQNVAAALEPVPGARDPFPVLPCGRHRASVRSPRVPYGASRHK